MSLQTILLHAQVSGCVLAFIFSLCLLVPIAVHETEFSGNCILFSNGTRDETGHLNVIWSTATPCHYSLAVGCILLIVSVVQGYQIGLKIYRADEGTFLSSFIDLVMNTILTVMVLAAAIIITFGFKAWCDTIITGYQSCAGASVHGIDKKDLQSLSSFYLQIGTAQFGAWSSWVCWVALMVCTVLRSCWLHQQENLKVSMARERRRLLSDSSNKETYSNGC